MAKTAIIVNLKRCTGCWTCSMACKAAHGLDTNEWWQFIRTVGGSRIDEPAGEWPNLHMSWLPVFTEKCTLCGDRLSEGLEPHCVYNCPTKALTFGNLEDEESAAAKRMADLKAKGFREFKLPAWENTKPQIIYVEK